MITGQKVKTVWQDVFGSVGKAEVGFTGNHAGLQQIGHVAVEGDLSQTDDNLDSRQRFYLCREMSGAVANLLWRRFVSGRSASNNGTDPGVPKFQAIVAVSPRRLTGETKFMEYRIHEVAGAVTGEGATRSVGSMRTGCESENEHMSMGIAKS